MRFENELNESGKKTDNFNHLQSVSRDAEKLLFKNVINIISKKIDIIELKLKEDLIKKEIMKYETAKKEYSVIIPEEINGTGERNKIGLPKNLFAPDTSTNKMIADKIEENYLLLDKLEKSNRPIFSIKTERNEKVFVEDKIREMDSRLGTLFTAYRERCKSIGINSDSDIHQTQNEFKRDLDDVINNNTSISPADGETEEKLRKKNEKEERLKELHNMLLNTDKKIKKIAGTILKNF
jgi:hypothetical protein